MNENRKKNEWVKFVNVIECRNRSCGIKCEIIDRRERWKNPQPFDAIFQDCIARRKWLATKCQLCVRVIPANSNEWHNVCRKQTNSVLAIALQEEQMKCFVMCRYLSPMTILNVNVGGWIVNSPLYIWRTWIELHWISFSRTFYTLLSTRNGLTICFFLYF